MTQRTGDARFPRTNYKTSQHCIAYLDMLGGKNVICNDPQSEHLNKINMIFYDALEESKMFASDVFVKIFSDNILLAMPTDNDNRKQNIEKIIGLVNNIISEMADYGYLMRGAITEGDFFGNNIIAYGNGLVEAVLLEEEYAIYPRVIVQKEIAKLLPHYFYSCEDGWAMLNPYIFSIGSYDFINFRQTFLTKLKNNKANEKVRQKIMWAINNFNAINKAMRQVGALRSLITREELDKAIK
ncbi:hypothetical protein [Candidatus Avelusimicrobium faecicola]|uniref:hypothetical protein n=1 Tax=Candidatus Avelusimicrobium faecicola TaxID=3416205 RepID=UPI003D0D9B83